MFYDSALDLSDPSGRNKKKHPYLVTVTVRDTLSGEEETSFFLLTIKNPCFRNDFFTLEGPVEAFPLD